MAAQDDGYAIGVDLGTSNTVAVLRWPDGRTRPLLFDGQPIMPSGVFLDSSGRLHVGRDAQRLAQADPARYEPNPKRRVDEPGVLLGDREVPTAELLAGLLRAVAQAAVESVGFLPPAVVTHPADWGARRRDVLVSAVARAGWPPVHPGPDQAGGTVLVPEPVAAARYFTDALRRPVPVGSSLAVFDFGGGTLDIAVVRNEGVDQHGRARFAVIGSGGIAELGGLDLDAALVDHLGGMIGTTAPDIWRQLGQPAGTTQWRNRRQFWDDVRGAKEMLSRTTLAPVPIPGVDQAVHLTRDELERLAMPLLRRGVFEAASVIATCRLAPHQLAGLFLVGGSSRVPLVARLLHSELGVAPTVLEQPELPVAEGALAEAASVPGGPRVSADPSISVPPGSAPMSGAPMSAVPMSPAPTSAVPMSPAPPGFPPVGQAYPPAATATGGSGSGGRRRWWAVWTAAAAGLALVGVLVAAVLYLSPGGYDDIEFQTFTEVGRVSAGEKDPSYTYTALAGDRAYVATERTDKRLEVAAVQAGTAKQLWRIQTENTSDRWSRISAVPNALLVFAAATGATTPRDMTVLDPSNGAKRWSLSMRGDDEVHVFDEMLVFVDRTANQLTGLNLHDGKRKWALPTPRGEYDSVKTAVYPVTTDGDLGGPGLLTDGPQAPVSVGDHWVVQIGADRSARVIDVTTGKVVRSRTNVAEPDDTVLAHEGRLYVAAAEGGYWLAAYDLKSMGEPRNVYRAPDERRRVEGLASCGQQQVCLLETVSRNRETTELVAVDTKEQGARWRKPVPGMELPVTIGEHVMVSSLLGDKSSAIFRPDGSQLLSRDGMGVRIDGGNVLFFAKQPSAYAADASVAGVPISSGTPTELGQLKEVRAASCSWNTRIIVCPSESDFVFWRFAKD